MTLKNQPVHGADHCSDHGTDHETDPGTDYGTDLGTDHGMHTPIPVVVLSGFLGSGKTTWLAKAIQAIQQQGMKPAVIMNELGEVNFDGVILGEGFPMEELLAGCICCSIRGDLGLALKQLVEAESPDFILIEATGAANPAELIDGITEASLYVPITLCEILTLVDSPQLFRQIEKGKGAAFRLMKEQIRFSSRLLLNKMDLVSNLQHEQVREWISEVSHAPVLETTYSEMNMTEWLAQMNDVQAADSINSVNSVNRPTDDNAHQAASEKLIPHAHMMVVTYYVKQPLNSTKFERFLGALPEQVYRGKGLVRFSDTSGELYAFQLAYRQTDFMKIDPQAAGTLSEVVVLIGENLNSSELIAGIEACQEDLDES
ncbi:CobW family GTP-binding protein [Marinicrinis sediminis]|uniref:CobW family GTP-binding protein n=1 Tax=Marinicrinis sediminis TaxID=1652465 RepID=A0ABW5REW9_9BACL